MRLYSRGWVELDLEIQYRLTSLQAGKILRYIEGWRRVPDLTPDERHALQLAEGSNFWRQPKAFRVTIVTLCIAATVQGWNQTAANGANLNWPQQLLHLADCNPDSSTRSSWLFAIINASTYFSASMVGCWLSDPLSEYFLGRRAPIFASALIIVAASIGAAASRTWEDLLICRIILGLGMGQKASIVPVFAAEVSPAHIRGSLVMNWQLFDACGIFLGFTANLAVSGIGASAWRWQTASSILPTLPLITLIWVCPDSPRFLMKHRRYRDAFDTLVQLRGSQIVAAKELLYTHFQMSVEQALLLKRNRAGIQRAETGRFARPTKTINYFQKLGQLFREKRIRRATLSAAVAMITQQLCGVNVLAFYSSTFFRDADAIQCPQGQRGQDGHPQSDLYLGPLFLSWGTGLVNFIFAFPAYWLIDKKGRRWLLLVTLPFLALSLLGASLSFLIPRAQNDAQGAVVATFAYIFYFFYSWGVGPVPFTLSAEVFPLENRVVGMSFSVFVNLFGAALLTLFVPALMRVIGQPGLLGIFAGLNIVAFLLVFFYVRETAGASYGGSPGSMTHMSLEELNYIFGVSNRQHARYQIKEVIPWLWRKYVRRDPEAPGRPPQLYTSAASHMLAQQEADEDVVEVMEQRVHGSRNNEK
ncbi:hypothetical protein K431DRAFT_76523 [Polychaeton citri CBS 116435]|uniref:Major facilitator superfamily (MFS) profile domain-containing protein n=1 Tax=Polychaeton citri CBS 116435 TaxID=1314669 RepID=A0A9P4UPS8_9PEZI|nr:hypothetical protein K431DRAFT_76523 [Polychaeton citri CBS 116435]